MPLASSRRSTFSSEGSVNTRGRDDGSTNRRRRGSLSRQSHPSTIESTTHVSEDKIMKLRRARRPSGTKATGTSNNKNGDKSGDKENASTNAEESLLQSPTPYWKTRKDSSQFSPRETRSNKKKKKERQGENQTKEKTTVKKLDFLSTEDLG